MIGRAVTDSVKEVAPPLIITSASFAGVSFQNWVYILTAVYTLVQILRTVPKIIGCSKCFYTHRTCDMKCKEEDTDAL